MTRDERIKQLLDDAERKHAGADYAEELEERDAAVDLATERDDLIAEAHRLDPHHLAPAWDKTTLPSPFLPTPTPLTVDDRR